MSMLKFVATALATAASVNAACSASATLTVQNAGDASAISSCSTYSGSIAIATGTSDPINFPSVKKITGDLTISNAPNLTSVGADSLQEIGGAFEVNNDQILNTLNFPQLTAAGTINFQALPNLPLLGFSSNVAKTRSLNIQNTFLNTLDGINLQQVDDIYIANNRLLQDISFQVSTIKQSLILESNGDRLSASFPNLISASNLTFRNCPSVSIPSLHNVTGSLGFYENTFESLAAPNLTTIGGTLAVNTNDNLKNITFPVLKTIGGGFQVQNNTQLKDGTFSSVESIGGALDFYGAFSTVSLPALKDCRGAFNLQSTDDVTDSCNVFGKEKGPNNVIKGKYQCAGKLAKAGNAGTTPTNSGASSTKSGDAGNLRIPASAAAGLTGVLAAIFGML
ncbi:hypothetical protein EJ06DRAFT_479338 [Trichodelitschia bisporula]|uniref:GPI-anchored cell wall organization protein Ecm33 n=1 Tax=Trichodelitschia bisporula TaxID=703511 RepID=A0A6G1HTK9_9PEZI|nr:hypothetical protein EJ06DRAFT_479338 [Trichodelitschia bisporula]